MSDTIAHTRAGPAAMVVATSTDGSLVM